MHTRKTPAHSRRGLSRVELIAIIAVVAGVICIALCAGMAGIMLPALAKARSSARQIKCGTQVRNTIQAMTIFAQGNRDSYPLPSLLDTKNQTVQDVGRAKDTSGNILSILIYNNSISPELLYCPSESSVSIAIDTNYQNSNPTAAVSPANALWDPAFRCDFTSGVGNNSYAMLMANGDTSAPEKDADARARLKFWSNTFNALEPVFGNRGPLVTGRDAAGNAVYNTRSNTMLIHGGRTTWEGNIGYNDNHVNFETRMDPQGVVYRTAGGNRPDIIFFDEPNDTNGENKFLGIWIKAGTLAKEYKGIND